MIVTLMLEEYVQTLVRLNAITRYQNIFHDKRYIEKKVNFQISMSNALGMVIKPNTIEAI